MYRGTTPTITINCDVNVAEFVALWVTFKTTKRSTYADPKAVEITKQLGDDSVTVSGKTIGIYLKQVDTLLLGSLDPDSDQTVEVQVRGRTSDGRAYASNVMTTTISRILKEGEI